MKAEADEELSNIRGAHRKKRTIVTELGAVDVQHPEAESTNPPASASPETTVRASSGTRFRNGGITPGAGR